MTEQQENNDNIEEPKSFDEKLNDIFLSACQLAFLNVPEIRSIVVTYDYKKGLNESQNVGKGVWLSRSGSEKAADEIVGSLQAVLQNSAHILDEAFRMQQTIQDQLLDLSKELLAAKKENANVEKVKAEEPGN